MSGIGSFIIGVSAIGEGTSLGKYLNLVTSEHRDKPNYIAMLTAFLQPMVDGINQTLDMPNLYDLDEAVGVQLDVLGLWIGRSRFLKTPITGVYFTYNTGPGYNVGIYKGPFDPVDGLTALPDGQYRTYLKAVAAANQWNGTITGAYAAYAILFEGTPFSVVIYDFQDMSMSLALLGGVPDALTQALFTGGYLSLKPAGVRIREYIVPVNPDAPVFAYNITGDPRFGGYNVGAYAKHIPAS